MGPAAELLVIGRAGLLLSLRQECGLKCWEVRGLEALPKMAVREGSAHEFQGNIRKRSAHSSSVLNGSVLTGHIL